MRKYFGREITPTDLRIPGFVTNEERAAGRFFVNCDNSILDNLTDEELSRKYPKLAWRNAPPHWPRSEDYSHVNSMPGYWLAWELVKRLPKFLAERNALVLMENLANGLRPSRYGEFGLTGILTAPPDIPPTIDGVIAQTNLWEIGWIGFETKFTPEEVRLAVADYIKIYGQTPLKDAEMNFKNDWGVLAPWGPELEFNESHPLNPFSISLSPPGKPKVQVIIDILRILDGRDQRAEDKFIFDELFKKFDHRTRVRLGRERLITLEDIVVNRKYLSWQNFRSKKMAKKHKSLTSYK